MVQKRKIEPETSTTGDLRAALAAESEASVSARVDEPEAPPPRNPRKAGRKKVNLSQSQMSEICEHLIRGHGRLYACVALNISYKVFMRNLRSDARFAYNVYISEKTRVEKCESIIYRLARETENSQLRLRAAVAYLSRRDKVDEARRARREGRIANSKPRVTNPHIS